MTVRDEERTRRHGEIQRAKKILLVALVRALLSLPVGLSTQLAPSQTPQRLRMVSAWAVNVAESYLFDSSLGPHVRDVPYGCISIFGLVTNIDYLVACLDAVMPCKDDSDTASDTRRTSSDTRRNRVSPMPAHEQEFAEKCKELFRVTNMVSSFAETIATIHKTGHVNEPGITGLPSSSSPSENAAAAIKLMSDVLEVKIPNNYERDRSRLQAVLATRIPKSNTN